MLKETSNTTKHETRAHCASMTLRHSFIGVQEAQLRVTVHNRRQEAHGAEHAEDRTSFHSQHIQHHNKTHRLPLGERKKKSFREDKPTAGVG